MRYQGLGTEKLQAEIEAEVPRLRRAPHGQRHDEAARQPRPRAGAFRDGLIHILLGTQMIAKGLDFPNVTLVGVVNADVGLHLPDFRSAERTFQLLSQVAGRAGRGPRGGRVLVQTFTPGPSVHRPGGGARLRRLRGAANWRIGGCTTIRRISGWPGSSSAAAIRRRPAQFADRLAGAFRAALATEARRSDSPASLRLLGPAEAPVFRLKGYYRYHFQLQSPSAAPLHQRPARRAAVAARRPASISRSTSIRSTCFDGLLGTGFVRFSARRAVANRPRRIPMQRYQSSAVAVALLAAAFGEARQDQQLVPPAQTIQNPRGPTLPALSRTSPPTAAELPKLAGSWKIVSGERNGQRIPDERIAGLRVTINADTITIFDRDNKPFYVVRYKLDTSRTPNWIDMTIVDGPHRGEMAQGMVTMDSAEQMRLVYSTGQKGRPNEFRTLTGGDPARLFILKRAPTEVLYAGEWQAVDAQANGKKLPAEQINKTKIVLTANTLVLTDTFTNSTFVANYKTNTTVTPNQIDMTVLEGANKGKAAFGIIAPEGADRLLLCFAVGGQERPKLFRTGEGGVPRYCYTLARLKSPVGVQPGTIHAPAGPGPSAPSGTPAGGVTVPKPDGH